MTKSELSYTSRLQYFRATEGEASMQKWRGMNKGLPDAPKRSKYRVRKGWHRVLFENSAKHPTSSSDKDSPKSGKTYRHVEDAENSPSRIPFREIGARHHFRTGWFRKFLMSRVGRSWDSVYSEIRQNLDYRNGAQAKTLQQILYHVEVKCFIGTDGDIYHGDLPRFPVFNCFYVHPVTGTLEYADDTFNQKHERLASRTAYEEELYGAKIVDPSDERNYLKKDSFIGIWYAVRTEPYTHICDDGTEATRYRVVRMQLSHKDLLACGLENSPQEQEDFYETRHVNGWGPYKHAPPFHFSKV